MRTTLALSLIAVAGCKGKPQHRPPPPNVGSAAVTTGSGDRAAPDLALPAGPGTPPLKTTRKLGRADFEKLATLEYPGFEKQQHGLNDTVFEVRQITKDHPRLSTTITIEPCGADTCWPIDLDTWKKHEDELKKKWLPEPLQGSADVDWQIGNMIMRGTHMIGVYQLGQHTGSGVGGDTVSYTDALLLFYNDGVNSIRVVAEYKDDPAKTKQIMAQRAPKPDLEALAQSFMDVYTHAWPTS